MLFFIPKACFIACFFSYSPNDECIIFCGTLYILPCNTLVKIFGYNSEMGPDGSQWT